MSEYPYEGRIHSKDKVDYKTVFSSDGIKIGKVEAAFADSFIVKSEKEKMEIKYEIPRLEIASIKDNRITELYLPLLFYTDALSRWKSKIPASTLERTVR